jgi:uncharacterized protein with von Willebrand factor type A (vWA) domain
MFEGLFFALRGQGVPVAMDEWLGLQDALERGLTHSSLGNFYLVARSLLVKSERHYDSYDVAFEQYFSGIDSSGEAIGDQVWDWLADRPEALRLTPEQKARLDALMERLDMDEIRQRLEERLRNQDDAHRGGNRHVGTGGTSPFGHSGYHPGGFRIGGQSGNRTAVQVAGERRWRDYRSDETLGVRDFSIALRRLRRLSSRLEGPETELDVQATIDATAEAGGRLELAFTRPRKNAVRVLLLLDVGGSMDDHVAVCNQLFSAVHQANHFADLQVRYFHNCVYDRLYRRADMDPRNQELTLDLLAQLSSDYKLVVVGDACMAPSELSMVGGAIDYYQHNDEPGWTWLERLSEHFTHSAWLNPVPEAQWGTVHGARTLNAVRRLYGMHELSVDGLEAAAGDLMVRR